MTTYLQKNKKKSVKGFSNEFLTKRRSDNLTQSKSSKKVLRVGDICQLEITALAPNNIGIDEYSYASAVFVPNASYGSTVKAKILKINTDTSSYAIGQVMEEVTEAPKSSSDLLKTLPVNAGDILTVSIPDNGVVQLTPNFRLIIPSPFGHTSAKEGVTNSRHNVKVRVTRVKASYGFAQIENQTSGTPALQAGPAAGSSVEAKGSLMVSDQAHPLPTNSGGMDGSASQDHVSKTPVIKTGYKFTTMLPLNSAKYGKYIVFKLKETILFVKLQKGVKLPSVDGEGLGGSGIGHKVRIKITSSSKNCAVGQILQVNPIPKSQKKALVMNSIRDMINHGMHFGEKAVKCHARMKNYIWFQKTNVGTSRALIQKGRHVINLFKTRRCFNKALNTLTKYALKGRTFLFIGTKKPAAGLVARASFFTNNSFYVNTRWLGGMLTNWKTICKSISKIRPILKEKQKVVRDILERRQNIKSRLIQKALLFKKKSQLILTKGRALLNLFQNPNTKNELTLRAKKLVILRNELMVKGMNYIQKRQKLIQKRRELIVQTLLLKEKGFEMSQNTKLF